MTTKLIKNTNKHNKRKNHQQWFERDAMSIEKTLVQSSE
jgi:hypothetical protein